MPLAQVNGSSGRKNTALILLREAGAEVLGIVSIFTYGMQKGLDRLAAANVKNVSLLPERT